MIVGSLFTRDAHHAETKITEVYFVKKGLQVMDALFCLILRKKGVAIKKYVIFGNDSGLQGLCFAISMAASYMFIPREEGTQGRGHMDLRSNVADP